MAIKFAYLGIIIIWTTTPLAIQWSSGEGDYLIAVTIRMAIGLSVMFALFITLNKQLPLNNQAIKVYCLSGISIFLSMSLVYWGAQFIPSGWIAIVFGLSPIITGILTLIIFKQATMSLFKFFGLMVAVNGIGVMFARGINFNESAGWGLLAVLISTITHSLGAVLIKQINTSLSGMQATLGGLVVAVPLFCLAVLYNLPHDYNLTIINWSAIIYLGIIATSLGFSLYYYVLNYLDAIKVSMITLITPITALFLGALLNSEPLANFVLLGAGLVLMGLGIFQFEHYICRYFTKFVKSHQDEN